MKPRIIATFLLLSPLVLAQGGQKAAQKAASKANAKSYNGQSSSTFSVSTKDDAQTIEISNVTFEITNGATPGLPPAERLVLRKTVHSKQITGDIGEEGSTTVEAWPIGTDFRQKPLYTLKTDGEDPMVVDGELLQVLRGLEEVPWWSLYKLGNGQHLFDTYVPLAKFSISRDTITMRYVGVEVPEDDVKDARLKDPHVVAVVTYASGAKVIREALITADDPKQAALLRSYADSTRLLEAVERDAVVQALRLTIRQNYPSPPNPVVMTIPLAGDDLDLRAQMPAKLHIAAWKR
jgi:hypothetical protein